MYVLIIDSKDQQSYFAFDAMRLTENEEKKRKRTEVVENFKKNQEKRLKNADAETSS